MDALATIIIAIILMTTALTGCGQGENSIWGGTSAAEENPAVNDSEPIEAQPALVKYGILIDVTTSIPEELGSNLVALIIEALIMPDLPEDLSAGMRPIGAQRFYVSFVDANPLKTTNIPSAVASRDWLIPGVDALPPRPDLANPDVKYETYSAWKKSEQAYRNQYQERGNALSAMKSGLAEIDLALIRETAQSSAIFASFDKLLRTMTPEDGSECRIIYLSDFENNSDVEIASINGVNGSVYAILSSYGTAETEQAIEAFNNFIAPYGFGPITPFRPEAERDAIFAWLSI